MGRAGPGAGRRLRLGWCVGGGRGSAPWCGLAAPGPDELLERKRFYRVSRRQKWQKPACHEGLALMEDLALQTVRLTTDWLNAARSI